MKSVNTEDVRKLVRHSLAFAVLMKNQELDSVVATFIEVLDHRKSLGFKPGVGGDENP